MFSDCLLSTYYVLALTLHAGATAMDRQTKSQPHRARTLLRRDRHKQVNEGGVPVTTVQQISQQGGEREQQRRASGQVVRESLLDEGEFDQDPKCGMDPAP